MTVTQDKNDLVIRIPLGKPVPSASGKTFVVASSRGNMPTGILVEGQPVIVGFNAFIHKAH